MRVDIEFRGGRVLSSDAAEQILQSPKLRALVGAVAARIRDAANAMHDADGYVSGTDTTRDRVRGYVVTGDGHTIRSNRRHNTLIRAMDAGRG